MSSPTTTADGIASELASFCVTHGVEEVVLFYNGEEWNTGHLGAREEDVWLAMIRDAAQHLRGKDIRVSLSHRRESGPFTGGNRR